MGNSVAGFGRGGVLPVFKEAFVRHMEQVGVCALLLTVFAAGCFQGVDNQSTNIERPIPGANWERSLSDTQVALVRQSFPDFEPELFAPGADRSDPYYLNPRTFAPAFFFGPERPEGRRVTPKGILLQTNGYDSSRLPDQLPSQVPYWDRRGMSLTVDIGNVGVYPLQKIEQRMGIPVTSPAPVLSWNRRSWQVDAAEVDRIFEEVQRALAVHLPEVHNVSPWNCEIVIEPTVFYVTNSNFGNTWAGGLTHSLAGNRYRLHVLLFYVDGAGHVVDWRLFLVDELINFFVLSIGRPDLAI